MTITLRQTKGSALTHAELDGNFIDLSGQLDGIEWESQTNPVDNNWNEVTYGNGLFVAISGSLSGSGNRVMTSPDGVNWTIRSSAADNPWTGVAYGDGIFVAVANSGGTRVMSSPDGFTWTLRIPPGSSQWSKVTYGNGLFVAVSTQQTNSDCMTSPDGINWTIQTVPVLRAWQSVTYGNGLYVAVSSIGTGDRVMTSPDGVTWTSRTSAADHQWLDVIYGNGLFVAVAGGSAATDRIMTSPDGITWTTQTTPPHTSYNAVTYGNGIFVAIGQDVFGGTENVLTSTDGIVWTVQNGAAPNIWGDVVYGNGMFVAVSANGTGNRVMTSGFTHETVIEDTHRINGDTVINGDVGIGTQTPAAELEIARAGLATLRLSNTKVTIAAGAELGAVDFYSGDLSGNGQNVVSRIVGIQPDATPVSGELGFFVGGLAAIEAMRIEDSGNVGIGTTTPDGTLHVHTATAGAVTADVAADDLVIENSTDGGLSILTPDANKAHIFLGSPTDNVGAFLSWKYTDSLMSVATSKAGASVDIKSGDNISALYIDSSQNVGIGTTTPDGKCHVHTATAGAVTANNVADDLIVENSTNGGISVLTPDANTGVIAFGSPSDEFAAYYNWNYSGLAASLGTATAGAKLDFYSANDVLGMTLDASQNLGIGIGTPDGKFHSHSGSAGTVSAHIDADEIIAENSANAGISILAPDAANSSIYFGSPTDNLGSLLQWNYNGGVLSIGTSKAGASVNFLSGSSSLAMTIASDQGAYMIGATGGSQGSGTFNAVGVYDDGVLLTCYVPHYIVDGKIDLSEWDGFVPNKEELKTFHEPARRFVDDVDNRIDVSKFTDYWKTNKHLPTMPSKEEWIEDGPLPTGKMVQKLWETVELQAAHIDQLLTRIEALEGAK